MALQLPSEIVVNSVLPTVRVLLARALDERGFTQQEVADRLGVTQAAVSRYVAGEADVEPRIAEDPRTVATVETVAEGFETGDIDEYDALAELLELVRELEDRGPICALHEEAMPALAGMGCDLCVRGADDRLAVERETLADVRKAARLFAHTEGAARVVPNVGTNVGMALPDADDHADVAAIPGRIYEMDGRVEVPANPEFGASRHVAGAVLAATAVEPTVRAAINVKTDDRLLDAAREQGLDPVRFDADYEDRERHLRERFREAGVGRVAYHEGAFGIEPVTYVFGTSATDAVQRLAALIAAADAREP